MIDSHTYDFWGKCIPRGWSQVPRRDQSYVYFIAPETALQRSDLPQAVKIGVTSGDPLARLATFQTGSPCPLDMIAYVHGNEALEKALHATFANYRLHGEWFRLSGHVFRLISRFEQILTWIPNLKLIHEFDFAEAIAELVLDYDDKFYTYPKPPFGEEPVDGKPIISWFRSIGMVRAE